MKRKSKQSPKPSFLTRVFSALKNHFVPHEGNNHHPHALHHRNLLGYSIFLVLIKVTAIVLPLALPASDVFSSAITPQTIIQLTNQARQEAGLNPLQSNTLLSRAALAKANDMLAKQYFAHNSPDGLTPWTWLRQAGYAYAHAGENLAVHYTSAEDVRDGWMTSPGHRANILNARYTETGVNFARGQFEGADSFVVVQFFGEPPHTATNSSDEPIQMAALPTRPQEQPQVPAQPTTPSTPLNAKPAPSTPTPTPRVALKIPPKPTTRQTARASQPTTRSIPATQTTTQPVAKVEIKPDTLRIQPATSSYQVAVEIVGSESANVHLAGVSAPLEPSPSASNTWIGSIEADPHTFSLGGESLYVTAAGSTPQESVTEAVATIAPESSAQQVFSFQAPQETQTYLFGLISAKSLSDSVNHFYIYFIIFLFISFLINLLVKFQIQNHTIHAHVLGVMILAAVLALF